MRDGSRAARFAGHAVAEMGRPRPFRPLRQGLEALALRGLGVVARALPFEIAGDLGAWIGRGAHAILARRRAIALDNLTRALGPNPGGEPAALVVRRVFEQIGRSFVEFLALPAQTPEQILARIEFEGFDPAATLAREGRGAVLLTGHFGNWELFGAAMRARYGIVKYVLPRQTNPASDAYLNEVRAKLGIEAIPIGVGMKGALRSLREGAMVAMLPDQDARGIGIYVDFFGRPASTLTGPARIAMSGGATILTGVLERTGRGRYRARMLRVLTPDPARDRDEETARLTAEVTRALEEAIRERPDHWYWIHRRWKTPPPPDASSAPSSPAIPEPAIRK